LCREVYLLLVWFKSIQQVLIDGQGKATFLCGRGVIGSHYVRLLLKVMRMIMRMLNVQAGFGKRFFGERGGSVHGWDAHEV
jgi:hypothetical protein